MLNKGFLAAIATGTKENYWIAKLSTATNNEYVKGIAVSLTGDIYFTGRYTSTVGYGLVGKLTKDGALSWQRSLGESFNTQIGEDVCVDSLGNIYVVFTEQTSGNISYVASYTSSGVIRWQRSIAGALAQKIAIDDSDNLYIAGYYSNSGTDAGFIAKYNSSGVLQWQKGLTSIYATRFEGLTVDSSGNLVVCGYYIVSSYRRFLTVKYSSSGTVQFQRAVYSSAKTWYASAVSADSSGNIYVFGTGDADFFAIKYNASGSIQTAQVIDRFVGSDPVDAFADSSNNMYVITSNNIGTYFGTERRTDFYAVKYASDLSISWQRYLGTTNSENGYAIAVFGLNKMYLAGLTYSNVTTAPNGLVACLPSAGNLTGTYGSYFYNSASWSTVSKSYVGITPTLTDSTASLTEAASSLTDSAVTLTVTKTDV
jgi:hypothetical protein